MLNQLGQDDDDHGGCRAGHGVTEECDEHGGEPKRGRSEATAR